jgi:hypothetical protein
MIFLPVHIRGGYFEKYPSGRDIMKNIRFDQMLSAAQSRSRMVSAETLQIRTRLLWKSTALRAF